MPTWRRGAPQAQRAQMRLPPARACDWPEGRRQCDPEAGADSAGQITPELAVLCCLLNGGGFIYSTAYSFGAISQGGGARAAGRACGTAAARNRAAPRAAPRSPRQGSPGRGPCRRAPASSG